MKNRRRIALFLLVPMLCVVGAMTAFRMSVERARGRSLSQLLVRPGRIDLLALIDPEKDALRGIWNFEGHALVSPLVEDALLRIPYAPAREYEVLAVVEWLDGPDGLGIGLARGNAQVLCALDSYNHRLSGMTLLDHHTADRNETTRNGTLFRKGEPLAILCCVRDSSVSVFVDGREIIHWRADYKRWSLRRPWIVDRMDVLFLCSLKGIYRTTRLDLWNVNGQGRSLR